MKKVTVISLILVFAFTGLVVARDENPKTLQGPAAFRSQAVRAYLEGFEGAFPPAGWTHTITNAGYTWYQSTNAFEGNYAAQINWQDASYQNEILSFEHAITAQEFRLHFATMGSVYWAMNADFTVRVDGVVVWSFYNDFTAGSWTWDIVTVDLGSYVGQTVDIAFVYEGNDGADHHLDVVSIDDDVPPPPPPPPSNNLCEDAIDLQEQSLSVFEVDLCLADNNYNAAEPGPSCTGFSTNGRDVVYKIYLMEGEFFSATQQGSHDNAIWLVTDCSAPSQTCVAGADNDYTYGGAETLTYTAEAEGWYYLIIDGYGTDVCSVTTVWIDAPLGTREASWSTVKSLYR